MGKAITGGVSKYTVGGGKRGAPVRTMWRWYIHIPAEMTPPGQERKTPNGRGFERRDDAQDELRRQMRAIEDGLAAFTGKMTFEQFVKAWEADLRTNPEKDHYLATSLSMLKLYALPWLKDVRVDKLKDKIAGHYEMLSKSGKHQKCCYSHKHKSFIRDRTKCRQGEGLARTTINSLHLTLGALMTYAVKKKLFILHPFKGIGALDNLPKAVDTSTVWTAEQAKSAVVLFREERLGAAWVLALTLGLRRGEIAGLRWDYIDLDKGTLRLEKQRTQKPGIGVVEKDPKYGSKDVIILDELSLEFLKIQKHRQARERLRLGRGHSEFVFDGIMHGTPICPNYLTVSFQRACKKYGLPVVRLHDLRGTCATLLIELGASVTHVQGKLRHKKPETTQRIYIKHTARMQEQTVDLTNALYASTRTA